MVEWVFVFGCRVDPFANKVVAALSLELIEWMSTLGIELIMLLTCSLYVVPSFSL